MPILRTFLSIVLLGFHLLLCMLFFHHSRKTYMHSLSSRSLAYKRLRNERSRDLNTAYNANATTDCATKLTKYASFVGFIRYNQNSRRHSEIDEG